MVGPVTLPPIFLAIELENPKLQPNPLAQSDLPENLYFHSVWFRDMLVQMLGFYDEKDLLLKEPNLGC